MIDSNRRLARELEAEAKENRDFYWTFCSSKLTLLFRPSFEDAKLGSLKAPKLSKVPH